MSMSGLAGHARRPSVWGVQAPPPPPPPPSSAQPPVVPPSGGYAAPPPQPRKGFPWLWVILGCGCLTVVIVIVGVAGGAYFITGRVRQEVQQEVKSIPQETLQQPDSPTKTDDQPKPEATDDSAKPPPDAAPAASSEAMSDGPSEDKAIAAMLKLCDKGWVAKIVSHSSDWTKVTVKSGPPASEWIGEVDLKWTGSEYEVIGERSY
jgi:hypothetical protein